MWFYGLPANNCGTYVKKPMTRCSGEEIMREFLYYCSLEDKIDEIMPSITAIPVVMPYITSQFMPRKLKDRPEVIPAGNRNLAFIGQFVELEGDVVFTVETSVRTAMIACTLTVLSRRCFRGSTTFVWSTWRSRHCSARTRSRSAVCRRSIP